MKKHRDATDHPPETHGRTSATEDVAAFFPWANLSGSRYRDYSASRDRSRADARNRGEANVSPTAESVNPQAESSKDAESQPQRAPASRTTPPRLQTHEESLSRVGLREVPRTGKRRREDYPPTRIDLPALAFFSLAGGTGKTSLAASIGCLLATEGESSLLVDTHAYGLLPLFFGARELSPGSSRTFSGGNSAPLRVMRLAKSHLHGQSTLGEIAPHADGMDRILIDISTASFTLLREILPISPTVLVVLAPDMASVVSLLPVQRALQQMEDETDTEIETFFVLNQFDPALRLHRDIRDRLTRQLGKFLLPIAIHRSHAMSEALAGGTTILDYAPDALAVDDLRDLAQWVREIKTSAADDTEHALWGGQRC